MKLGVLFSGGKDSTYAAFLAKKLGHELTCLISVFSLNQDSYMFHTPSIGRVQEQANSMKMPLVIYQTLGEKEEELLDLEAAIKLAKKEHKIQGIVTGALHSDYQATRIQKICDKLKLNCLNPLWHKDEIEYLNDLIKDNFKIIIVGVAAYPLDKSWLGKTINENFISEVKKVKEKYKIHPAGEGGEFETLVLNCPLFSKELRVKNKKISGEGNSWRMEADLI